MHLSRMTLDELYVRAGQLRRFIEWVEQRGAAASVEQVKQKKAANLLMKETSKEIKKRAVQMPLFGMDDFRAN